jgi:CheY-like chemotaxis protein
MQKAFRDVGIDSVRYFTNALQAIKYLKGLNNNSLPNITITDSNMPSVDGSNLVSFLKHNELYKSIIIIIVMTTGLPESERKPFLTAGVTNVIFKPVTEDDYQGVMTELMAHLNK